MEQLNNKALHKIYYNIKDRCYNPKSKSYKDYGAKGIVMSKEFLNDSKVFYKYMRELNWYKGCAVSRYNDIGNYERGNLKVQTFSENSREVGIRRGSNIRCIDTQQVFLTVVDAAKWVAENTQFSGKIKTIAENIRCKGLKGSVSYGYRWERTYDDT